MSGLQKRNIKGSNCNEILPNPDGSINVVSVPNTTDPDDIKELILCAPDVVRAYTWATVAGVRKVTEIVFTSASVDTETGNTNVLTRTYTYDLSAPFDLLSEVDVLTIT